MCFSEKSLLKEALSPQEMQRRQYLVASWSLFYDLDKRFPLILELKKPVAECWRKLSFDLWTLAGRWEEPRMSRAIWPQMNGRGYYLLTCFDPWTICCCYCSQIGERGTQVFSVPPRSSSLLPLCHRYVQYDFLPTSDTLSWQTSQTLRSRSKAGYTSLE